MNTASILAAALAAYTLPAAAVKYGIDHTGHVREDAAADLRHAAALLLALAAALTHFGGHRG